MMQTTTTSPLSITPTPLDRLCHIGLELTTRATLGLARLVRLVPAGVDWFIGLEDRSAWGWSREEQTAPAFINCTARLGRWEVVVSVPRG